MWGLRCNLTFPHVALIFVSTLPFIQKHMGAYGWCLSYSASRTIDAVLCLSWDIQGVQYMSPCQDSNCIVLSEAVVVTTSSKYVMLK